MNKNILIIVAFLLSALSVVGQNVFVSEPPEITKLMNKYLRQNKTESTLKGWRIQIITTPDRRKMQNAKARFESLYPRIKLSWNHIPPYYKVVIGGWEDKISCDAFLIDIKEEFPSAIPVVDSIEKRELVY